MTFTLISNGGPLDPRPVTLITGPGWARVCAESPPKERQS